MYTHVLQQHQIVHPRLVWFWPDHSFQGGLMKFITDNALHTSITASKVLPLTMALRDSALLYHGSTSLYLTHMTLLHSM